MKILSLIIKQAWFDKIMFGKKKKEFRDITPNTQKKYCEVDKEGYCVERDGEIVPRHYDAIRFYVGYNKNRDTALVEVKGAHIELYEDKNGNLITDTYKGIEYYKACITYELGKVIER